MSASVNASRGGQPSTTTPTPPPCDSPQVVMRKSWPKVFPMGARVGKIDWVVNRDALCSEDGITSRLKLFLSFDAQEDALCFGALANGELVSSVRFVAIKAE